MSNSKPVLDERHVMIEPIKIFDDLYMIGCPMVDMLVLKTSEGLVLFDSTDRLDAYDVYLMPSLEKIGWQNEKILALFISHGHLDHYMGAQRIADKTGCVLACSETDVAYMVWCRENTGLDMFGDPIDPLIPRVTLLLEDGKDYVYGDHSIHVLYTPGHTPGCLSFFFDGHENGEAHRVALMGGYGIFGPDRYPDGPYPYGVQWAVDQALLFAAACVKFWEYVKETNCEVYLNPHGNLCDAFKHDEENKNRKPGEKNAFLIGPEGVRVWILDRFNDCLKLVRGFTDLTKE